MKFFVKKDDNVVTSLFQDTDEVVQTATGFTLNGKVVIGGGSNEYLLVQKDSSLLPDDFKPLFYKYINDQAVPNTEYIEGVAMNQPPEKKERGRGRA